MYRQLEVELIEHRDGTYDVVEYCTGELIDGDFQSHAEAFDYCGEHGYLPICVTKL